SRDLGEAEGEVGKGERMEEENVRLLNQNAGRRQDVEEAKQQIDELEAQRNGLNQRLNAPVSTADRGPIEARMREIDEQRKQLQTRMQQAIIKAPISGTVFKFDLKPGAYLNPGDTIATIGKLNPVHVLVYVDEPDLGRVRKGMDVTITWEAI